MPPVDKPPVYQLGVQYCCIMIHRRGMPINGSIGYVQHLAAVSLRYPNCYNHQLVRSPWTFTRTPSSVGDAQGNSARSVTA